ncbi:ribosome biogenesis GTP-binding protein YihA/YsxC [Coraliomargarita parva]|uniref:ribosome biogenesis GTP-binding protein YihA/YsxC n=1 Tax=Coraliomargarita parva TaxID=3014050 RepID=UPI0022B55EEF|nr:ribosome biogenesis GTP-binding protein YihA/YsxC [Coraliomargarita parva]
MKITDIEFLASAFDLESCPATGLPEFAFVGRSNVGKSSLINLLTATKELAHTSSKPGKTQRMNFFRINGGWVLVDLPGYGYAKVSRQQQHEFNVQVSAYLTTRPNLKQVFSLVDSSIEPQGGDLSFMQWMQECGVPYSVVFTKTDRSSDSQVEENMEAFEAALEEWGLAPTGIFHCSAKSGKGRGPILHWIDQQLPKKKSKAKTKGKGVNLGWMKK